MYTHNEQRPHKIARALFVVTRKIKQKLLFYRSTSPLEQMTLVAGTAALQYWPNEIALHCAIVPVNFISERLRQLVKALLPIDVRLAGISMLFKDVQSRKA